MTTERWRVFIGVLLPDETRAMLVTVQQQLHPFNLAVRWTRAENLHITLHFLGDIAPTAVATLQARLDDELRACIAPIVLCDTLGAFPNKRRPRVLWAGTATPVPALLRLNQAAVAAGLAIGVPAERRPYHPHVTLGYVREQATPAERATCGSSLQAVQQPQDGPRPYPVVALIRSVLGRDGATYTPLATWTLP